MIIVLHAVLIGRLRNHFKEDWEDPGYVCSSDAPRRQQPPRMFLNEERSRMGSDHAKCECAPCAYTVAGLQCIVKFLQMVREVYEGSDRARVVFDACFILVDKMLHGEIDLPEFFDRLHCMFVNDSSLVQALLWLGAPTLIWTRSEVVERIRGFEENFEECMRDRRQEYEMERIWELASLLLRRQ